MAWDSATAAHRAVFDSLKRDGQFREAIGFDDAGKRKLSKLAYWLTTASPGMRRAHARNYVSGMVLRMIRGHDLTPDAGSAAKDWDAAYAAIEAMMLDATNHTVADVGELMDATYDGWDA